MLFSGRKNHGARHSDTDGHAVFPSEMDLGLDETDDPTVQHH